MKHSPTTSAFDELALKHPEREVERWCRLYLRRKKKKRFKVEKLPAHIDYDKVLCEVQSKYLRGFIGHCEFHRLCMERDIVAPCKCRGDLQLCHLISRGKKQIKFDEQNLMIGCESVNNWGHWHEADWDKLWRQVFPDRVDYLERALKTHRPLNSWSLKHRVGEYEQKLKRLGIDINPEKS